MRTRSAALAAVLLAVVTAAPVAAATDFDHARIYDLSLGDSLAAGVQPTGDPANLYRTPDGYADRLFELARADQPKLTLVKLGCPGESTRTMIEGGICTYPHGSQLDEAVAFLHAHRSRVAFVTIDLGANDFPCNDIPCIPQGVVSIQGHLPAIVAALREAAGPDVPIVGMTLYDPLLGTWFQGPDGQAFAHASVTQAIHPIDQLITGIFVAGGARVADVEDAFHTGDFDDTVELPGVGSVPLNVALICQWTWICAPAPLGPNNHPNADGYRVIARAFADQLGL
jgi:lysophospholipase L1-like esterase